MFFVLVALVPVTIRLLYSGLGPERHTYPSSNNKNARSLYHWPQEHQILTIHEGEDNKTKLWPEEQLRYIGENAVAPQSGGIYVSIKTAVKYHKPRLPAIMLTWLQNISPSQVELDMWMRKGS